jgi:hypothetical protein
MTFARALWADLVDKRLWPVAALLLAGLIAIPVVLPRLSGSDPAPPPLPAAAAVAAPAPGTTIKPVTLVTTAPARRPKGRYDDPFSGGPGAAATAAAAPDAAAPASSPAAPASASSSSSGGASDAAPSATPSASAAPAAPAPASPAPSLARSAPAGVPAGWRVDVAWGRQGDVSPRHDVLRFKTLRTLSSRVPAISFMGVSEDHRRAYFLPAPGVSLSGDGLCLPSRAHCELVGLRRNQSVLVAVPSGDGFAQYQLDVDAIRMRRAETRKAARHARAAVDKPGRRVVARLFGPDADYTQDFRYSALRGVLVVLGRASMLAGSGQAAPEQPPLTTEVPAPGQ